MTTLRIALALALAAAPAATQDKPASKELPVEAVALGRPADFAQDVLPILKSKCLACHNAKDKEADLILESPAQMIKGGESGPAVVPGKADESLLLKTAAYRAKPYMPPPKNKIGAVALTPKELGILKVWINEGAKGSAAAAALLPPPSLKATPAGWNPIYAVAVDPEAQYVACGRAGRLYLYHVPTQKLVDRPGDPALAALAPGLAHTDAVQAIAFSPDGRWLATGGYRAIKIWKKSLAEKASTIDAGGEPVKIALSPDGAKAAAAFADFAVRVFDVPSGKRLAEHKDHTAAVVALRFSPDGQTLLTASADKTARLYGPTPAKVEAPDAISAAELAGGRIVTGHPDGTIRVWDGEKARDLKGHKAVIADLRAAGAGLLSVAQDGKLKLWNLEKGEAGKDLAAAGVTGLAVSPDAKRWITLGAEGAKLWDAEGAKPIADLKTDGPARRKEQHAAALLAFAGAEVGFRQGQVKKEEDEKKKEDEEVKKAADAIAPAETARKEKDEALGKAKAARETSDKALADAKAALEAAKAKVDGVMKALEVALTDDGLKKLEAEHGPAKPNEAAVKAVEDAQKRADAAAKAVADAKAAAPPPPDKGAAEKALAEAQKVYDDAKAKAAAAAKALAEAQGDDAKKKAEADKKKADEEAVATRAKRNDARAKVEAATKTPASQPPSEAVKKAEAEKAAADAALAEAKKAVGPAAAPKLLVAARAAAGVRKAEAEKAVVDQAPVVSLDPLKKAVADAKDEEAKKKAEAALADAQKSKDAAKAKADAAAAAVAQAKAALEAAKKDVEADKADAEKAVKAGEAPLKDAEKKQADAKKAEEAAAQAAEQAKLAFESAGRRAEKAKEAAAASQKAVEEAQAALKAQQEEQKRLEEAKKQATDAAAKASAAVACAGFSSDGALVVLGAADGRVFLYDAAKGGEAGLAEAHKKAALAAGGAGTSIVSLAADGTVRTAAVAPSWTLEKSIAPSESGKPPVDRVTTLAFSPDGKLLASGGGVASREGELAIWSMPDGALVRSLPEAHSDTIYDAAFSPDGTRIATAGADKFAKVFDVQSGKHVRSFEGHTYHVLGVSWSRNGRTLATAGGDSAVKVWSVHTGQQVKTIQGFDKQVTSIRYLGLEGKFAVAAGGTAPKVVKEDGGSERNFEAGGATFFYALATSADGRLVAAGGLDGVLRLWRAEANPLAASFAP